jgi:3-phenylpropionate/trans-cinnamate dioxygenase ferredoxin reductase component
VNQNAHRVVIVGAGQAGGEAALRLRQAGYAGDITLIGEEPLAPYQRPPLSKKYLAGEWGTDRLLLRDPNAYAAEGITLLTNTKVTWIDRAKRIVRLENLRDVPYENLILATGSRARSLPLAGADLEGVHLLRTAQDVDAIRAGLTPGASVAVIGAGYIGLETAAVLRQLGHEVTVLEAQDRPLSRVTSPEVSAFFLHEHAAKGVKFRLGALAAVITGTDRVTGVSLVDGGHIAADLVIAGVGILPETKLAESIGLEVKDGILTDATGRTSDTAIFAIGDCARRPIHFCGVGMARLESVHNALEGAKIAAATISGTAHPAEEVPWFWSDQYDLKLQIAGLFQGYDHLVVRGNPADRAFAAFYFKGARLIAVDAINRPAEFLGAKQLIQRAQTVAPAALEDMSTPMKEIIAKAQLAG